jgi:hypothetical protein
MKKAFLLAGFALAFPPSAQSEEITCQVRGCPTMASFASISDSRSYGFLIAAPESGCRHVRFRIEGEGAAFLGNTPPLAPGELAVVRMGHGFPAGENWVTIASVGCDAHPAALRRVVLGKQSPDHGWRAGGD